MRKFGFLIFLPALIPAACAGYRLGTTLPGDLRTVYVRTFENRTEKIEIALDITDAVITRFRQDGNLAPAGDAEADTALEGEIVGWSRMVLGTTGRDDDEVDEYRLVISARISLFNRKTSAYLVKGQVVQGTTDFFVGGSLPESEDAAAPDAYRDLARAVVDAAISVW